MSDRPLMVALDFAGRDEVNNFLQLFDNEQLYVKVGMELFYSSGPGLIDKIKGRGHRIFLDLKLHDIPNTVNKAMKALARLDVDMVNVHAAGGSVMMKAAIEGLEEGTKAGKKRPSCIAVTQLTSTTEDLMQQELLIHKTIDETVVHYAQNAEAAALDGVVCSPLEVPLIRKACNTTFITVTPGIRLAGDAKGDQHRVTTPRKARELGSSAIVVGRSITAADDPVNAYKKIIAEWSGELETTNS
ncbi:orotidine-5'-phosphate decarboxylase [Anaerobacillus sp. MEB173]|uniref:orotidine-5'-phosphate decarboxylase n=1 Tax=Anaerobacillus sp. MEB173 TaxID=3383345 RepID=UPI003F8F13EA